MINKPDAEALAENRLLRMIIERDRSIVATAAHGLDRAIGSYAHLLEGRGSHEWDDDSWRDEFRDACRTIARKAAPLRIIAGDRSNGLESTADVMTARAFDLNVERLKACEHIAEGDENWQTLRDLCPSTAAVATLRDAFEAVHEALNALAGDVSTYPAWQRPCHALDVAIAALEQFPHSTDTAQARTTESK